MYDRLKCVKVFYKQPVLERINTNLQKTVGFSILNLNLLNFFLSCMNKYQLRCAYVEFPVNAKDIIVL